MERSATEAKRKELGACDLRDAQRDAPDESGATYRLPNLPIMLPILLHFDSLQLILNGLEFLNLLTLCCRFFLFHC